MVDDFERDVLRAFAYTGICKFADGQPHHEAIAPRLSAQGVAAHQEAGMDDADWAMRTLQKLAAKGMVAFVEPSPRVHTRAVLTPKGRRVVATGFVPDYCYDDPMPAVDDQSAPPRLRYATLLFSYCDVADEVRTA